MTDYEKYIRTAELLALQKPPAERSHPEELLFQVMHQVMELWLKVVVDESARIGALLETGKLSEAAHHLRRIHRVLRLLQAQFEIVETMPAADYHVIRLQALGRGSGQQSPGFHEVLALGAPLWAAFEKARAVRGIDLFTLFQDPRKEWDLYQVAQGLLEFDEAFQTWRFIHYEMVKRIIGLEVKSLTNVPASQLKFGVDETFFPELWKQIPALTRHTRPEY